ncbi:MAG: oxidoreductase [Crocinitomicaceae bacterium]|nr:oxidoreductase [Crocinitomicaceae bacterium]|tara:strand:- start:209 stop:1036 length:828 start_codon:yes stop_codon:yes gene_type:complete
MKTCLNKFSLKGETALITGASGLLGVEHAKALLETGATVVLTDIDKVSLPLVSNDLIKTFGQNRVICKTMDVTKEESIKAVAIDLASKNIGILINNAAIDPKVINNNIVETSRLENFLLDDWNSQLNVGLTGAMLCSKIFGAAMAQQKRGVILNIASDLSVFAPDQRLYEKDGLQWSNQPVKPVTYSVIKHGLIGLTKYLSTYWCDRGVRCNALSPGGILKGQNDDFVRKLNELIPIKRMASNDEYRSAVQFLCSDASAYMNGQNVVMDGGRSAW